MPVAKGPKFNIGGGLLFGGLAVVVAIVIGFVAITLGSRTNRLVLGDTNFGSINVVEMAETIRENGPVLWPDISNGNRDIWLQHTGDSPGEGWTAFDARLAGSGRECNVTWSITDRTFTDPCSSETFPQDGDGLPEIPVFIDEFELIIDINGIHESADFSGFAG